MSLYDRDEEMIKTKLKKKLKEIIKINVITPRNGFGSGFRVGLTPLEPDPTGSGFLCGFPG